MRPRLPPLNEIDRRHDSAPNGRCACRIAGFVCRSGRAGEGGAFLQVWGNGFSRRQIFAAARASTAMRSASVWRGDKDASSAGRNLAIMTWRWSAAPLGAEFTASRRGALDVAHG